jgi:hypothetical protein
MGPRAQFTKGELRYLKRCECLLCDQRLDRFDCSAIWREPCTEAFMVERAKRALLSYKPRAIDTPAV